MASEASKKVAYNVALHLRSQVSSGILSEDDKEGIDVAVQCVCEAYQLDLESEDQRRAYAIAPSLEELVLGANPSDSAVSTEISDEDKATAEAYKQQGNVHLKASRYEQALECYSKAVAADPSNATFFCNRAATFIKLDNLELAAEDCKKAISLNPDYARAHGRLGFIYSTQGKLPESKESFLKAISLDSANASYQENLQVVIEKMSRSPGQQATPQPHPTMAAGGPAGGPQGGQSGAAGGGAGGMAGGGAGGALPGFLGAGLGNLLQNPGFMNMASNLMQSPAFQNMASQMMARNVSSPSDITPEVMSEVSGAARQIHQENPEVVESFQRQIFDGMAAATRDQQQGEGQQEEQQPQQPQDSAGTGSGEKDGGSDKNEGDGNSPNSTEN